MRPGLMLAGRLRYHIERLSVERCPRLSRPVTGSARQPRPWPRCCGSGVPGLEFPLDHGFHGLSWQRAFDGMPWRPKVADHQTNNPVRCVRSRDPPGGSTMKYTLLALAMLLSGPALAQSVPEINFESV